MGLDQLRGILAFSVMIYHYAEWSGANLILLIREPLELIGLYAVSTFYTLSGCALFIVYRDRKLNSTFLREFWIKRAFRIVPLFWLVSLLTILIHLTSGATPSPFADPWKLFLNFSLLFSWLDPTAYYATGAWSIGNEWAFYTLFPIILLVSREKYGKASLFVGVLAISAWYSFRVLNPDMCLTYQWKHYIHPLNQLILFTGGVLLGPYVVTAASRSRLPLYVFAEVVLFVGISY